MKSTLNIATAAMMRPLGEMLFSNGREQGMAAGANMVRSLAAADYDQSRAQGQQQRNYYQSPEHLDAVARMAGGDFGGVGLGDLMGDALKNAQSERLNLARMQSMTGDSNFDQYGKGRQLMAVHDAAVYENNPIKAGGIAAAFNDGKRFDNAGNGLVFDVTTGDMRGSPVADAQVVRALADADYNRARAEDVRQGTMMVSPDGKPMLGDMIGGGRGFATPSVQLAQIPVQQRKQLTFNSPEIDGYASHVEQQYGLPPGLIMALKNGGERSNSWQRSPKGAQGVMQFIPSTWAQYGRGDPTDPVASIDASGRYLADMMKRYNGNVAAVVTEYNGGIRQAQHVAKGGKPWVAETAAYLPRVMNYLQSGGSGGVPMKYAGPQMAKQMYPTGGDKFTQVDAKHPVFQKQVGVDVDGKPITEFNADQYNRFNRWAQANGYNNQQQAMQVWSAAGMPDAGGAATPQIPEGGVAAAFLSPFKGLLQFDPYATGQSAPQGEPSAPQAPARASAQKEGGRITTKAIMEQAQKSHSNPGMVVDYLRKQGVSVPSEVIAELKRKQFAVN